MLCLSFITAHLVLFFAFALLIKNEKHVSDTYLAVWLIDLSLYMVLIGLKIENLDICFCFLHCVLLFFYIESITRKFKFKKKYILHFMPFVIILFFSFFFQEQFDRFKSLIKILSAIYALAYFIEIFKSIKKYNIYISKNYSNLEMADISWLYFLSIGVLLMYTLGGWLYIMHTLTGSEMRPILFSLIIFTFVNVAGLRAVKMNIVFVKKKYSNYKCRGR